MGRFTLKNHFSLTLHSSPLNLHPLTSHMPPTPSLISLSLTPIPHPSLPIPHPSPLTPHPHPSPLTPHPSPPSLTPHPSPPHPSSLTPLTPHPSPLTPHPSLPTIPHHSSLTPSLTPHPFGSSLISLILHSSPPPPLQAPAAAVQTSPGGDPGQVLP